MIGDRLTHTVRRGGRVLTLLDCRICGALGHFTIERVTKSHDRETRTRWPSPADRDPHSVSSRTGNARADVGSENGDDGPGNQRDFRTHEQLPFAPRAAKTLGLLTSSNEGAR